MKTTLVELISKISSGCMGDDEIASIADEFGGVDVDFTAEVRGQRDPAAFAV